MSDFDESGRSKPTAINGSEYSLEIDTIIVAIGQTPNSIVSEMDNEILANSRGCIQVNEVNMSTTMGNVYAGGDAVTGSATVISALGAGKLAAKSIFQLIESQ